MEESYGHNNDQNGDVINDTTEELESSGSDDDQNEHVVNNIAITEKSESLVRSRPVFV